MSASVTKNNKVQTISGETTKFDPRNWIPVQYLSTLYTKDILQAISNQQLDHPTLTIFVNAVRRSNNGPLNRFGIEHGYERAKHLINCVEWCKSGLIENAPTDVYSAVYAYLFLLKEDDSVKRLFLLQRWVKEQGIVVGSVDNAQGGKGNINNSMRGQLQEFLNQQKVEAIFTIFERILKYSRPKLIKPVVNESTDPVALVSSEIVEIANAITSEE